MGREIIDGKQKCRACGEFKEFNEFSKHKRMKYGIDTICLKCNSERVKNKYNKRKENTSDEIKENLLKKEQKYYICKECGKKVLINKNNKGREVCSFCKRKEKIIFICKECGKKVSIAKKNYTEDLCSECKNKKTKFENYGNYSGKENFREIDLKNFLQKCTYCGEWKSFNEFSKHKKMKYGINTICLECGIEKVKKWREENPELKQKLDKKYYEENKEKFSEKNKELYKLNKEKYIQKSKKYYEENKEKILEKVAAYRQTDKGKMVKINSNNKRRAILKENDITKEYLLKLKKENTHCPLCGNKMNDIKNDPYQYNLDHILPLSSGGRHIKENIRFICRSCNISRAKIIDKLEYKYNEKYLMNEFNNIINNNKNYNSLPQYNRIVLTFQEHFYEIENILWQDEKIKEKLLINREKYLFKPRTEINQKELLRGFKISGIHYGFSHFNPFWIKTFIEEFNVKSIYDPCGGWGHRLLGAWNIKYYYNDNDYRTYSGVKNIFNKFKEYNKEEKLFFNNNAEEFKLNKDYEAIFTCPPYYNLEKYLNKETSSNVFSNYNDWLNEWWRMVVKNANPSKYFVFVISTKLSKDMIKICEEEGYNFDQIIPLGKSKSHFNTNNSGDILVKLNV